MKWHKGPPPSVGWWPASMTGMRGLYRWWNGEYWSLPATVKDSPKTAAECARKGSMFSHQEIEWAFRPKSWPKRSRT